MIIKVRKPTGEIVEVESSAPNQRDAHNDALVIAYVKDGGTIISHSLVASAVLAIRAGYEVVWQ